MSNKWTLCRILVGFQSSCSSPNTWVRDVLAPRSVTLYPNTADMGHFVSPIDQNALNYPMIMTSKKK